MFGALHVESGLAMVLEASLLVFDAVATETTVEILVLPVV